MGGPGLFDCWIFIGILLMETAGVARDACGAGGPARHGGKCTRIAGNHGTFPGGGDGRCGEGGLVVPVPRQAIGEKCTRIAGNHGTFPGGEAVVLAG